MIEQDNTIIINKLELKKELKKSFNVGFYGGLSFAVFAWIIYFLVELI